MGEDRNNENKYQRHKRSFFNWFKGTGKEDENKQEANSAQEPGKETLQEKRIREEKEELKKFIEEFKSQTSLNVDADKLTNAINNFQFYESKLFESYGYDDGTKGVKDKNVRSSASVRADFIYEHASSILQGKMEGLTKEKAQKNQQLALAKETLDKEKRFNEGIHFLNKKEHRHFSKGTGWFYILVGISLMFADFPISLDISKYFIDLPIKFEETFWNKITHPEILLFSLGITFLSIYYKIIYDDYVNKSIIPDEFYTGNSFYESQKRGKLVRTIIKLSILFILLYLLWNIGQLRSSVNALPIDSPHGMVNKDDIFNFKRTSFVLTTILLPTLSGICLSVGFGMLANASNLSLSDKKFREAQDAYKGIELELTLLSTTESMLEKLNEAWNDKAGKIHRLTEVFSNSYYQGYKRGHRARFGYDVYANANALYIDHINSTREPSNSN